MSKPAPAPNGRRTPRYKIFEPALLKLGTQEFRAHLLNVSSTGALINTRAPLATGMRIHLHVRSWSGAAYVVRHSAGRHGVVFAAPLEPRQMEGLIGELG